ncbi:MAG: hypothetical protein ACRCSS_06935 [Shewanella sp.]
MNATKYRVTFKNGKTIEVKASHNYKAVSKARKILNVGHSVDAKVELINDKV